MPCAGRRAGVRGARRPRCRCRATRARHQDGVSRARPDLHTALRATSQSSAGSTWSALEDVGVRVVDLGKHPRQLHRGVAGQRVTGAGQRVAGQADVEWRDAPAQNAAGPRRRSITCSADGSSCLLQRPAARPATGQDQPGAPTRPGAALPAQFSGHLNVGKRPGQRRQEGHAEQCENARRPACSQGLRSPSRASPLMAGARWPALRRGAPGGPRRPARNGAASVLRPARYRR